MTSSLSWNRPRQKRRPYAPGEAIASFTVVRLLAQGGYGDLYAVRRREDDTETEYAMKTESSSAEKRGLITEITLYETLQDSPFFPRLIESGITAGHRYFVMEMLGPSVSAARRRIHSRRFSKSTALRLSLFMLQGIKEFHAHGFVHCDIKPGNFLLRSGGVTPVVLIDYGLSRRYIDRETNEPFPETKRPRFAGTVKYASPHMQRLCDPCPRDDIISWVYSTVELMLGRLPWNGESEQTKVLAKKEEVGAEVLKGMPSEFQEIWRYLWTLGYSDCVFYDHIICLVGNAIEKAGIQRDEPFDWEGLSEETIVSMGGGVAISLPVAADCHYEIPGILPSTATSRPRECVCAVE